MPLEQVRILELRLTVVDNRFVELLLMLRDVRVNGMTGAFKLDSKKIMTREQQVDFDILYPQLLEMGRRNWRVIYST